MKNIFAYITVFIPFLIYSQEGPCEKKYNSEYSKTRSSIVVFPHCNDTSVFLVRTFEGNKLYSEEWYKNNMPDGVAKYYSLDDSLHRVVSETSWSKGEILQSISYFPNSFRVSFEEKRTSDSSYFNVSYYQNGNMKEYGNKNVTRYCQYGEWTEFDSLSRYKWVGHYRIVNKEVRDTTFDESGNEIRTVIFTCSEKDGVWKKLDMNGKVMEQIIFINGKRKEEH